MNLYANPWYYYLNGILIKTKKPVLPGEYVHTHSIMGCYKVYHVDLYHFFIYKNRELIKLPWTEFRCRKGYGSSVESKIKNILKNIDNIKIELNSIINII